MVCGVIYCVEHIVSGKKYIGQTRSHRLNHGRYRPFGVDGRFREHKSCAIRNTKNAQCSALYNDIRLHGPDVFKCSTLELCPIKDLDQREQHWIKALNTGHPIGYNLTRGGRVGGEVIAHVGISTPLNPVGKRGGCTHRSADTRSKMSANTKAAFACASKRILRAEKATAQHAAEKAARFADVTIDSSNLEQYIYTKGKRVFVRVSTVSASFVSKNSSQQENKQRALEFLQSLTNTTATLPNCSGNP